MSNTPTITSSPDYDSATPKFYENLTGAFVKEDLNSGTSAADSMDEQSFKYKVPNNMEAQVTFFLGVDDWGFLSVKNSDSEEILRLSMMPNVDATPGPRGGHVYWSKKETVTLAAGVYTVTVHHENATYPAQYDSKYNISKCDYSIKTKATNLFALTQANTILSEYTTVGYHNKTSTAVYSHIGGRLNDLHLSNDPEVSDMYEDSCALRVSIALCQAGLNMPANTTYPTEAQLNANPNVIGSSTRVIIRAAGMNMFLNDLLGACHFNGMSDYLSSAKKDNDILIFADNAHVGICTATDYALGGTNKDSTASFWLVNRASFDNPDASPFNSI